jgi:hypothetical protein
MHGHRLDAELAAGALDAQRNFAPIGDQDLFEHRLAPVRCRGAKAAGADRIAPGRICSDG